MKRIIFILVCSGLAGYVNFCRAQTVDETVRQINDSVLLYEKRSCDIIVNQRVSGKRRQYKLKVPKIAGFNIKGLSKEDDMFLWVKIVSVKKAYKGAPLLPDSLRGRNIFVEWRSYEAVPKDSVSRDSIR